MDLDSEQWPIANSLTLQLQMSRAVFPGEFFPGDCWKSEKAERDRTVLKKPFAG